MEDDLKQFLSGITDWESSIEELPRVPEGVYTARLQDTALCQSKKGNWQISRQHLILSGEAKGQVLFDYMQLGTPQGPFYVAQWVRKLGFEMPTNPLDLENVIEQIKEAAPTVQLEVKHSGDFVNGRVLERVDEGEQRSDPT